MLPVSISSSSSDQSPVELLPLTLLITSSLLPDSSINCFVQTFFSDLDFFFLPFAFNRTEYLLQVLVNSLWLSFCGYSKNNIQAIFGFVDLIQKIKSQYGVEESICSVVKQLLYPLHTIRCHRFYYFGQVYEEQKNHLLKVEASQKN